MLPVLLWAGLQGWGQPLCGPFSISLAGERFSTPSFAIWPEADVALILIALAGKTVFSLVVRPEILVVCSASLPLARLPKGVTD